MPPLRARRVGELFAWPFPLLSSPVWLVVDRCRINHESAVDTLRFRWVFRAPSCHTRNTGHGLVTVVLYVRSTPLVSKLFLSVEVVYGHHHTLQYRYKSSGRAHLVRLGSIGTSTPATANTRIGTVSDSNECCPCGAISLAILQSCDHGCRGSVDLRKLHLKQISSCINIEDSGAVKH